MSVKIIQEKLETYHPASWQEEEQALKEISQEIALAALGQTDFFKKAVFQGGTALRILYSLDRFSEDLDFVLKAPDRTFQLNKYFDRLKEEFNAYGISCSLMDRSKADATVQKAFLKEDSLGGELILRHFPRDRKPKKIQIKLEVDTNPPSGSEQETRYLDFPFPFAVTVQNSPSLFAGKSHALLCREYTKGRDWYDFIWYVSRQTKINFEFLSAACRQQGPWKGKPLSTTKEWVLEEMEKKIRSIPWEEAKKDVARFLKPKQQQTLSLWGLDFFLERLKKLGEYL